MKSRFVFLILDFILRDEIHYVNFMCTIKITIINLFSERRAVQINTERKNMFSFSIYY